jgi:hypothetical protein
MSVFDLAELAADVGPNPRNIGVLLELDGVAPDVRVVRDAVRARLGLAPRLAQRLRRVPSGAGRPMWENVAIDLEHHVRARSADKADLLGLTAAILSEPLDPGRPLWTLTVDRSAHRSAFSTGVVEPPRDGGRAKCPSGRTRGSAGRSDACVATTGATAEQGSAHP